MSFDFADANRISGEAESRKWPAAKVEHTTEVGRHACKIEGKNPSSPLLLVENELFRMKRTSPARRGAVLIITAALCALMMVSTFAFLLVMRQDAQATGVAMRHTQNRILLMAACNYVLEAGRIGWGQECFGWVDVRDGEVGPKPLIGRDLSGPGSRFPIGRPQRFPLYCWRRPPFAISPRDPNPIDAAVKDDGTPENLSTFGQPFLTKPDPTAAEGVASYADWKAGDARARTGTLGMGWFRLLRDGPATFVITCGSGGTFGYKDWAEIPITERENLFGNSEAQFDQTLAAEVRTWYRIEWSPAVTIQMSPALAETDPYIWFPTDTTDGWEDFQSIQPGRDNVCGTIQWVQRLRFPPDLW
jgi:hypothetical protein